MVNVEKQKMRALLSFKRKHITRLTQMNTKLLRRDEEGFIYEDIVFAGKVVGIFVYDKAKGMLTVKDNDVHTP